MIKQTLLLFLFLFDLDNIVFCCYKPVNLLLRGYIPRFLTYIHTYIFINTRSNVTIQDAKTVSGEIEKEAKN